MRRAVSSRVGRALLLCLMLMATWTEESRVAHSRALHGLTLTVTPASMPAALASTLVARVLDSNGSLISGAALQVNGARVNQTLVTRGAPLEFQVTPDGAGPVTIVASRAGFASTQTSLPVVQPRVPAQITALRAEVGIEPAGVSIFHNAQLQDPLYFQWSARTTATQRGSLSFADGSVMDMGYDTQVLIKNPARTYLQTGQIFLQIVTGGQGHDVETSGGTVAASEGTRYLVQTSIGGVTTVTVYNGRLSLRNAGGSVSIGPDQQSSIGPGALPSAPQAVPPILPAWTAGLPIVPGAGTPTLLYALRQRGHDLLIYVLDRHVVTRDVPLPSPGRSVTLGNADQDIYVATAAGILDVPLPLGQPRPLAGGILPAAIAALPGHRLAVATTAGTLVVLDAQTGAVVRSVPLGYLPTGIAASRNGAVAIVGGVGEVSLVDLVHGRILTTHQVQGATGQPAFSTNGPLGYVPLTDQGSLLEMSVAARGPIARVQIEQPGSAPSGITQLPAALAMPDGRVFVADDVHNALVAVDPVAGRVLATYPVGGLPIALALAPDNRVALVLGGAHGGFAIVDPYDGYVLDRIQLGGLGATLAVSPQPSQGGLPLGAVGYDMAIGSSVPLVESIPVAPPPSNPRPPSGPTSATATATGMPQPPSVNAGAPTPTSTGVLPSRIVTLPTTVPPPTSTSTPIPPPSNTPIPPPSNTPVPPPSNTPRPTDTPVGTNP